MIVYSIHLISFSSPVITAAVLCHNAGNPKKYKTKKTSTDAEHYIACKTDKQGFKSTSSANIKADISVFTTKQITNNINLQNWEDNV